MKLTIASDHGGYELKDYLIKYLSSKDILIEDLGAFDEESVDYPDYAKEVVKKILNKEADFGILVCGSGIGMSITANRYKGIRAALVSEPISAKLTRMHNDANILCLGGRLIGKDMAKEIVDVFLHTPFEGGRHERRIGKIEEGF